MWQGWEGRRRKIKWGYNAIWTLTFGVVFVGDVVYIIQSRVRFFSIAIKLVQHKVQLKIKRTRRPENDDVTTHNPLILPSNNHGTHHVVY